MMTVERAGWLAGSPRCLIKREGPRTRELSKRERNSRVTKGEGGRVEALLRDFESRLVRIG